MFQVKICGITRTDDANLAVQAGADAVGLNFYDRSPRHVDIRQARVISSAVAGRLAVVGVFVNASAEEIIRTCREVGLDWVQLHGDESAEFAATLPQDVRILRALRLARSAAAEQFQAQLTEQLSQTRPPDAILVDALVKDAYGGTGRPVSWELLRGVSPELWPGPIVLAGGLTPENVKTAIERSGTRVTAVDTASGVELSPGIKDPAKLASFVTTARAALVATR